MCLGTDCLRVCVGGATSLVPTQITGFEDLVKRMKQQNIASTEYQNKLNVRLPLLSLTLINPHPNACDVCACAV